MKDLSACGLENGLGRGWGTSGKASQIGGMEAGTRDHSGGETHGQGRPSPRPREWSLTLEGSLGRCSRALLFIPFGPRIHPMEILRNTHKDYLQVFRCDFIHNRGKVDIVPCSLLQSLGAWLVESGGRCPRERAPFRRWPGRTVTAWRDGNGIAKGRIDRGRLSNTIPISQNINSIHISCRSRQNILCAGKGIC